MKFTQLIDAIVWLFPIKGTSHSEEIKTKFITFEYVRTTLTTAFLLINSGPNGYLVKNMASIKRPSFSTSDVCTRWGKALSITK